MKITRLVIISILSIAALASATVVEGSIDSSVIYTFHKHEAPVYIVIQKSLGDESMWNTVNLAWEMKNLAHWSEYVIPLVEGPDGKFAGVRPEALLGVEVVERVFIRVGEEPASTDVMAGRSTHTPL